MQIQTIIRYHLTLVRVVIMKKKSTNSKLLLGASLVAQTVKILPAMWETWVWSLCWEDALEKRMATHSSILAWRVPWTIKSMGSQRVGHD